MPKPLFRILTKKVFILINIFIAIGYLIGCYAHFLFSIQRWFVGLFALSAFYLLVLLFFFFIFWLIAKSKWSLLFLFLILISWKKVIKIFPFKTSTSFVLQKQPEAIRIMSWNVAQFDVLNYRKSHAVHNKMISLINSYQPDIACFQEMVAGDSVVDLNNAYYRKFSFYSIVDFELALNFPDEYYSYNWRENYLYNQHFGIVIFSKFPLINRHTIAIYPYDYNSIFQFVDVVKGPDTLRVFNIHLQSLKFSIANLKYIDNPSIESEQDIQNSKSVIGKLKAGFLKRQAQADRVREEIEKSPYPVIVCGDLNDVPNSYAYETIGKGLQNSFEIKGSGLGRTFSGVAPTLLIDNIFVDKSYSLDQYTRVAKKLSDHFPIITDVSKKSTQTSERPL